MNKYPKLADKNKCTGCSACEQVCSKHSINMVQDIEGFLYPKVNNESCVGCLKCEKICPLNNPAEYKKNDNQECYCGIAKDEIWKSSTSGGAFTVICEEWGDDKTIVFGAEFDQNNYRIMHSYAEGVGKIDKYRGSKYVQSDMGDTITQIIKFLYEEKKVIFSGTPCQVAGVLAAVKDTKNLLCIDIVCHGVGSPKVFFEYCKYKEKNKGLKIRNYEFRAKVIKRGVHKLYTSRIRYSNNDVVVDEKDLYNNLFLQKILCRRSCDECDFTSVGRVGDITIADFKGLYEVFPDAPYNKNASAIIFNTDKGKKIISKMYEKMELRKCEIKDIVNFNTPLRECIKSPESRKIFFKKFIDEKDIFKVMNEFEKKDSFIGLVWGKIPNKLRAKIKKIVRN